MSDLLPWPASWGRWVFRFVLVVAALPVPA